MENQAAEITEKIRQQFENQPYPKIPLDQTPKDDLNSLFVHNYLTAYYLRNQRTVETEGKVILDAGCGSGYKCLMLAYANPGAKIVGIDLSEESVKLARERLKFHGLEANTEFHALSIYDLPSLGMEFDYINADEVLYLLPDVPGGLAAMKAVLKPQGIIRSNLHSFYQRSGFHRAQKLFNFVGLMEESPGDLEVGIVQETMKSLKDGVEIKARTWNPMYEGEEGKPTLFANHLLVGDKGFTIPDLFSYLEETELEFISMVNWRQWEVTDLFKNAEDLPAFWAMSLPEISIQDRLHLYELMNPVHRLLDFWCGHPGETLESISVATWETTDWENASVQLHPQLQRNDVKEDLLKCYAEQKPWEISRWVSVPSQQPMVVDSTAAIFLLPLWQGKQTVASLVERWQKSHLADPITLEPISRSQALAEVKKLLIKLEVFLYVLLEPAQ